jgi:hypothetical protein
LLVPFKHNVTKRPSEHAPAKDNAIDDGSPYQNSDSCFQRNLLKSVNQQSAIKSVAWRTTAFTGLRPVDARKTENPPAATPVQRLVIWLSSFASLRLSL